MKIDAHQHFWQYNKTEYAWINEQMNVLKRDFLPGDLYTELKQINFEGSIVVQARQSLEETKWLLEQASLHDFIKGVIGWLDLCSTDIEKQLEEHAKDPNFVGVRHVVHDEPDDNYMARDDFQHGISLLSKYHLAYDLLLFPKHLVLAAELVSKFPNQKFVLDHISKPFIKDKAKTPWDKDIEALAKYLNVYCKLSGMVTEADWQNWKPTDFYYYLDVVFNAFGSHRLMIGSDWPVCTVAGNYEDVMNIVIDYFNDKGENTLNRILGKNCAEFYLKR